MCALLINQKRYAGLCIGRPCWTNPLVSAIGESEDPTPPPTCSDYTLEWVSFDTTWGLGASNGTLNGVNLALSITTVQNQLAFIYSTWEGHTGVKTAFLFDTINSGVLWIALIRATDSPAFTSFGEYINNDDPTPVDIATQGNINCELNCYTTTFTMDNIPVTEWEGVTVQLNPLSIVAPLLLLSSPTLQADYTAYVRPLYGNAIVDPEFSMSVNLVGDQATMTFYSLYAYNDVTIKLDTGDNQVFSLVSCDDI